MTYTSIPTSATPDVAYWVNQGLSQVDANAAAADAKAATAQVKADTVAVRVDRGLIPDNTDLDTLKGITKAGLWHISSAAAAGTMLNLPAGVAGACTVLVESGPTGYGNSAQTISQIGSTTALYWRTMASSSAWNGWIRLDSNTVLMANGTDLNTLTGNTKAGVKYISSGSSAATILNRPPGAADAPAVCTIKSGHASGFAFTEQTYAVMGASPALYWRTLKSSGVFNPWEKIATATATTAPGVTPPTDPGRRERSVAAYQAIATGDFKRRRGGRIGTNGIAAIALRFDHNPAFYESKGVTAKMRELSLPATMNINSRGWTSAYSNPSSYTGVSVAQVQEWALYDGLEIANHGATHGACDTEARLFEEIQTGADELRAMFPRVAVEQWHAPGSTGTVNMGFGYGDAGNPAEWGDYYAGHLILANHAYAAGYGGGKLLPLLGEPSNGLNHYSFEESDVAGTLAMIKAAQNQGAGLKLMMHPNTLDLPGKMTTADLFSVLEYIAAERDAGRLLVLTTGGLLMADSTISTRHNLVRNAVFNGTSQWAGITGWTFAGGEPTTTAGGLLYQTYNLGNLESHVGGVREMVAQFKSTTGATVSLRLEDNDNAANYAVEKTVTLPSDGQWYDVRRFVTIPQGGTATLRFSVGRVSGGDVTVRKPGLLAA